MRPPADVRSVPRALALVARTAPLLGAKPSGAPAVQRVPSVEEVVEKEGFTPTLSQSEIYRPGAVLVPNAKGGHDVIVKDCLGVQAEVSVMSQSSIATSLATGVSARLGVTKGAAAAGIEKRLSFVDPEQRYGAPGAGRGDRGLRGGGEERRPARRLIPGGRHL
ncbi:MAG: hypothetical protein RL071_2951 [Pseudomonadota bacterium]|jgi:hypothetical protein